MPKSWSLFARATWESPCLQEKRAYIQGYADCVQALYHMGLLKENEGLQWREKL